MGIKYAVNEKFFDIWSREMAYVLGYLYADGSLEDAWYLRGKYIRVTSVEKYSIERIKRWLDSEHRIISQPVWHSNGKTRHMLRIGSSKLYNSLLNLGLCPNKSLTMKFPVVPGEYLSDFIRGYFDGDGCVYLERARGKKQKLIIKKLTTIFTSGSEVFLQKLNSILRDIIELSQDKIYLGHRSFQLRYSTSDSIKLFKFLYDNAPQNCYFNRKLGVYIKYFELRPTKVDKEIENILDYLNGHVAK